MASSSGNGAPNRPAIQTTAPTAKLATTLDSTSRSSIVMLIRLLRGVARLRRRHTRCRAGSFEPVLELPVLAERVGKRLLDDVVEAALDERGVALEELDRARVEPDAELLLLCQNDLLLDQCHGWSSRLLREARVGRCASRAWFAARVAARFDRRVPRGDGRGRPRGVRTARQAEIP